LEISLAVDMLGISDGEFIKLTMGSTVIELKSIDEIVLLLLIAS